VREKRLNFNPLLLRRWNDQTYNRQRPRLRADAKAMGNKGNIALYLDKELVAKSIEIGFNLGKKEKRKAETKYGRFYFCF
jgi:hypothetical protein